MQCPLTRKKVDNNYTPPNCEHTATTCMFCNIKWSPKQCNDAGKYRDCVHCADFTDNFGYHPCEWERETIKRMKMLQ